MPVEKPHLVCNHLNTRKALAFDGASRCARRATNGNGNIQTPRIASTGTRACCISLWCSKVLTFLRLDFALTAVYQII